MKSNPDIVDIASLIAEPSRAAMLLTLLGGQTLLASELARIAQITPQTASSHLSRMVQGGLLAMECRGRHHYFRLASQEVAHVLETLTTISAPVKVKSLRQSEEVKALCYARTCYDHLAGEMGVGITMKMVEQGWLIPNEQDFHVSERGVIEFQTLGIDIPALQTKKRSFARQCLDWSERRYHVAGALGAAIATRFFEFGWIQRKNATRAVLVTEEGRKAFNEYFDL